MAKIYDHLEPRSALAAIACEFYRRGWMPGTAGNLSARAEGIAPPGFWITASGMPKGQLEDTDFLLVGISDDTVIERFRPAHKPSAETSIHRAIYRQFPQARACLHVHSVDACIAASRVPSAMTTLRLPPLEVLKGFDLWEQHPCIDLPVFENWLEVPRIAQEIEQRFAVTPPPIAALVIRDHGITVWGESLQQAFNRVEVMEFIMSYLARADSAV